MSVSVSVYIYVCVFMCVWVCVYVQIYGPESRDTYEQGISHARIRRLG